MVRLPGFFRMCRPSRLDAPTPALIPRERHKRLPETGQGAPCRLYLPLSPSLDVLPTFLDRSLTAGVEQPANHLGTPSC